jgi:type II secretory pathway pseudopilin PulG
MALSLLRRRTSGSSIVELLIYIAIMSSMLLLVSQFAVEMIRGQRRASEVQRVHQGMRRLATLLAYDVRAAQSVTAASSTFDSDDSVLVFVDASGASVKYERSGTGIVRTVGASPAQAVTTSLVIIDAFRVSHIAYAPRSLDSLRITVAVSAGYPATAQYYKQSFTTAVSLR